MNTLIKEELMELSFWLTRLAILENKLDRLKPIHEKINDMIDNYCDHKGAVPGPRQFTAFICPKCHKSPV